MKHLTEYQSWWAWGDTHLASLAGTQAHWMASEPASSQLGALTQWPEPFSLAAASAAFERGSYQECVKRCEGLPFDQLKECARGCRQYLRTIELNPGKAVVERLGSEITSQVRPLLIWVVGVGLLLIGAYVLVK